MHLQWLRFIKTLVEHTLYSAHSRNCKSLIWKYEIGILRTLQNAMFMTVVWVCNYMFTMSEFLCYYIHQNRVLKDYFNTRFSYLLPIQTFICMWVQKWKRVLIYMVLLCTFTDICITCSRLSDKYRSVKRNFMQ